MPATAETIKSYASAVYTAVHNTYIYIYNTCINIMYLYTFIVRFYNACSRARNQSSIFTLK